jgi:hypothetical protein
VTSKVRKLHWNPRDHLTLGDVRLLVAELENWSDNTVIRSKNRFRGVNSDGSLIDRLTAVEEATDDQG